MMHIRKLLLTVLFFAGCSSTRADKTSAIGSQNFSKCSTEIEDDPEHYSRTGLYNLLDRILDHYCGHPREAQLKKAIQCIFKNYYEKIGTSEHPGAKKAVQFIDKVCDKDSGVQIECLKAKLSTLNSTCLTTDNDTIPYCQALKKVFPCVADHLKSCGCITSKIVTDLIAYGVKYREQDGCPITSEDLIQCDPSGDSEEVKDNASSRASHGQIGVTALLLAVLTCGSFQ